MTYSLIESDFRQEVERPDSQLDLALSALLIARCEYPLLDPARYLRRLDEIADEIASAKQITLDAISRFLFEKLGFIGNKKDYYDPRNSYLNDVLDRKTGIPITLSIVYIEIGSRLGIQIKGVGMPGHFLVKALQDGKEVILDPFNGGRILSVSDCTKLFKTIYGENAVLRPDYLRSLNKREILTRMLTNLKNIYVSTSNSLKAINIVNLLLILNPVSLIDIRDRGLIYFHLGEYSRSLDDLTTYIQATSNRQDAEVVRKYIGKAKSRLAQFN